LGIEIIVQFFLTSCCPGGKSAIELTFVVACQLRPETRRLPILLSILSVGPPDAHGIKSGSSDCVPNDRWPGGNRVYIPLQRLGNASSYRFPLRYSYSASSMAYIYEQRQEGRAL
jgi:hypothetical protein